MAKLTAEQVTTALNEILAEYGADHLYTRSEEAYSSTCTYSTETGEPDCIVGHVLAKLQPEAFALIREHEKKNDEGNRKSFGIGGYEEFPRLGIDLTAEARGILVRAQSMQDSGRNWGDAVAHAVAIPEHQSN